MYADVVLPETHFLERGDPIQERKGLKPILALRKQVVEPLFDSRPAWRIFKELADKLGFGDRFFYKDIDDYNRWKLSETGIDLSQFDENGIVNLAKDKIYYDRDTGLAFKTPPRRSKSSRPKWKKTDCLRFRRTSTCRYLKASYDCLSEGILSIRRFHEQQQVRERSASRPSYLAQQGCRCQAGNQGRGRSAGI